MVQFGGTSRTFKLTRLKPHKDHLAIMQLNTNASRLNVKTLIVFSAINVVLVPSDGFAFSQEEGGTVSQSDVIRAYDTNIPKPDGM